MTSWLKSAILLATFLLIQKSAAEPSCTCTEIAPLGTTCRSQKRLGNCFAPEMVQGGFCNRTCGRCAFCEEIENELKTLNCNCEDALPSGEFSCALLAGWNKCTEDWIISGHYCQGTCCSCPNKSNGDSKCACADIQPPGPYTCAQQASWGKCDKEWMVPAGHCLGTCCSCPDQSECVCDNIEPPGGYTCTRLAAWNKCSAKWMIDEGFCAKTCGRCDCTPAVESDSGILYFDIPATNSEFGNKASNEISSVDTVLWDTLAETDTFLYTSALSWDKSRASGGTHSCRSNEDCLEIRTHRAEAPKVIN